MTIINLYFFESEIINQITKHEFRPIRNQHFFGFSSLFSLLNCLEAFPCSKKAWRVICSILNLPSLNFRVIKDPTMLTWAWWIINVNISLLAASNQERLLGMRRNEAWKSHIFLYILNFCCDVRHLKAKTWFSPFQVPGFWEFVFVKWLQIGLELICSVSCQAQGVQLGRVLLVSWWY